MNEIVKMAIDCYNGVVPTQFSKDEVNDALRKNLLDLCGGEFNYKSFRRNKTQVFEIIEEALDVLTGTYIEEQFANFAEVRNLAWGDTNIFTVTDQNLFKVATIADGTNNLRRQRIDKGSLTIVPVMEGVKIYEEFERFLAGRIDWVEMVNRVAKSYAVNLATRVYSAIFASYSNLSATYATTGSFSLSTFETMVDHVQGATGSEVAVYGTRASLAKVVPGYISNNMIDDKNGIGFFAKIDGINLYEIKQAHIPGTDNFAINDGFLLILPTGGQKIAKVVIEGDALIEDVPGGSNADDSMEYIFRKKAGVGILAPSKYGFYKLT